MTFRLILFLTFVILAFKANWVKSYYGPDLTDGQCIMYGTCGRNPLQPDRPDKCLDCLVPTKPEKFSDDSIYEEKLYRACPHFK